ncbi:protein of unknown function (plasmid) [Cupriavidus taiwanensis]|nr:protein of unknown function [Cupriavidus taiwanensis]SPA57125.1 protein of unknown function [Cupriavidus taiwanensis]
MATVIANMPPGMAAFDEEIFGPFTASQSLGTMRTRCAWQMQSLFGLSVSIWSGTSARYPWLRASPAVRLPSPHPTNRAVSAVRKSPLLLEHSAAGI